MQLDLTDDEFAALVRLLKHPLDNDRFPHAPRLAPLKAILAKLEPPKPREPRPPPRVYEPPKATARQSGGESPGFCAGSLYCQPADVDTHNARYAT